MNKKYFHCQFLYRGCCRFLELVQLPGRHDVMVHQDVRLQVLGLLLGRTQPQPGGSRVSWPDTAREHVWQRVSQLLAATQRSEVPAVVRGAQQRRLGPGLGHAGAGPHQQLPLLLGRRLCHRPREEVPAPKVNINIINARLCMSKLENHLSPANTRSSCCLAAWSRKPRTCSTVQYSAVQYSVSPHLAIPPDRLLP